MFDGTCPLVTKVHLDIARHAGLGNSVIYIGHAGHVETLGSMGHYKKGGRLAQGGVIVLVEHEADARRVKVPDPARVACATQTTLSVHDTQYIVAILRARFPALVEPPKSDICYATANRQRAVEDLARCCDTILVLGARNSSNSQRLVDVAMANGARAYLLTGLESLDPTWLNNCRHLGITAGASSPEDALKALLLHLQKTLGPLRVNEIGEPEDIVFRLPRSLMDDRPVKARRSLDRSGDGQNQAS